MASYDKIIKYLAERIDRALSPLEKAIENQNIIIAQNKQMIDLLTQISTGRQSESEQPPATSNAKPADTEN